MTRESWATSPSTRKSMQGNKARDTRPELAVRRLLHARGLRYRVHARPLAELRRTADVLFGRQRVAVFIDGCYWHGCPEHYTAPKENADFWRGKVERNRERDRETDQALGDAGWTVLRFWSHESPHAIAGEIELVVHERSRAAHP